MVDKRTIEERIIVHCEEDLWTHLASAIIEQANEDYMLALKSNCQWLKDELEEFYLSDYGQRLSMGYGKRIIDRLQKEYEKAEPEEPEKYKWRLDEFKETDRNNYLTYNGRTKKLNEWAKEFNLTPKRVSMRICSGWSVERALETPVRERKVNNE